MTERKPPVEFIKVSEVDQNAYSGDSVGEFYVEEVNQLNVWANWAKSELEVPIDTVNKLYQELNQWKSKYETIERICEKYDEDLKNTRCNYQKQLDVLTGTVEVLQNQLRLKGKQQQIHAVGSKVRIGPNGEYQATVRQVVIESNDERFGIKYLVRWWQNDCSREEYVTRDEINERDNMLMPYSIAEPNVDVSVNAPNRL